MIPMLLTVNFMDSSNEKNPKLLTVCNMQIAGVDPEAAHAAYSDAIRMALATGFDGNGAELMTMATKIAMQPIQPNLRVLSANDDRKVVAAPAYTIVVNLKK